MASSIEPIEVYIETGKKKTFACAVDWPGWSRSGKDEAAALQALADYGPRYAKVAKAAGMALRVPDGPQDFRIVERLEGDASTDFGVPAMVPASDERPVDPAELARLQALVKASYQALDEVARAAQGKALRKGPRGGGRELEDIQRHVVDAEGGYLGRLGQKLPAVEGESVAKRTARSRAVMLDALAAAARGETAASGPRGGKRWPARYAARREAWHVLDHAWEIEDRVS